jgi:hypothetical protein
MVRGYPRLSPDIEEIMRSIPLFQGISQANHDTLLGPDRQSESVGVESC